MPGEQTEACENSEGSKQSQEQHPVHTTAQQGTSVPPAAEHVPAQWRIADWTPTIQACMRLLDRLIVLAFAVLAILIAWNVLK